MKRLVIAVIVVGLVLGGITLTRTSKIEYVAPEVVVEEKEVIVPEKQKREQEALMASSTEIEKAMEEAAQEKKHEMETEIKLNVNRKMQAELQEQELALEEKVSL
jgi:hypothetical protein